MTLSPSLRAFVFGIGSGLVGYFFVEKDSTTLGMNSVHFGWMLLGILTGVMGHILYDGFIADQPHNLFPFELTWISRIVLPSALIGAFGANLLGRSQAQEG